MDEILADMELEYVEIETMPPWYLIEELQEDQYDELMCKLQPICDVRVRESSFVAIPNVDDGSCEGLEVYRALNKWESIHSKTAYEFELTMRFLAGQFDIKYDLREPFVKVKKENKDEFLHYMRSTYKVDLADDKLYLTPMSGGYRTEFTFEVN